MGWSGRDGPVSNEFRDFLGDESGDRVPPRRMTAFDPLRKFGSEFSMTEVDPNPTLTITPASVGRGTILGELDDHPNRFGPSRSIDDAQTLSDRLADPPPRGRAARLDRRA